MFYRLFVTFCFLLFHLASFSQKRVFIPFTVPVFSDQFDKADNTWPVLKTSEMYAGYDNGDYFLFRNNPVTPYVLMASWPNELEKFHLKAAFRLGPKKNISPYVGIVVMASQDGANGVLIEINRSKEYRIRRIENGEYLLLSKKEWTKSRKLKRGSNKNEIEIQTNNGEYDLYFNGKYETSFSVHELFQGNFGIITGPNTKAKALYYNVISVRNTEGNTSINGTNYSILLRETLEKNKLLEQQVLEQKERIVNLTDINPSKIAQLESAIKVLENELLVRNQEQAKLEADLQQMQQDVEECNAKNQAMQDANKIPVSDAESKALLLDYQKKIEFLSLSLAKAKQKNKELIDYSQNAVAKYRELEIEYERYREKVLKKLGIKIRSKRRSSKN